MGIYMSSTLTYRYENFHKFKKNGVYHQGKEEIMDGTGSGLKIFYNNKVGEDDSKTYVLKIVETSKDKFSVKERKGGKDTESEVDAKGLVAMVKANKQLGEFGAHVVTYLTKERGTYKGKKASKKASKKLPKNILKNLPKNLLKKLPKKDLKKDPKKDLKKHTKEDVMEKLNK